MTAFCECCGSRLSANQALQLKVEALTALIEAAAIQTTFDGFLDERAAAAVLACSPLTLRNRRLTDAPIPFRKLGRRAQYSVQDLAKFLLDTETNFSKS
jgi:hypothetical protein